MTVGVSDTAIPPGTPAGHRSRNWLVVGALALVVALVVGLVMWTRLASSYRDDLKVSLAHPPECTGGVVHRRFENEVGPPRLDVIAAKPGLSCTLTVRYVNSSPVTLHLGTATWPLLGRGSKGLLLMTGPGVVSPRDGISGDGVPAYALAATEHLDRDLAAGAAFELTYRLVFNASGCLDGTFWLTGMPVIEVTALGLTKNVHGSVPLATSGHYRAGCPP